MFRYPLIRCYKHYKINVKKLQEFQLPCEKFDYIIRCYYKTLTKKLEKFYEKYQKNLLEKKSKEEKIRRENLHQANKKELFSWLKLNTTLVNLRVNLKTRLMEVIRDPSIFHEIEEAAERLRKEKKRRTADDMIHVNFKELTRYRKPQKVGIKNILKNENVDQNTYYVKKSDKIRSFSWDRKKEKMFRKRKAEARVDNNFSYYFFLIYSNFYPIS